MGQRPIGTSLDVRTFFFVRLVARLTLVQAASRTRSAIASVHLIAAKLCLVLAGFDGYKVFGYMYSGENASAWFYIPARDTSLPPPPVWAV